jgi:TrmH family RNA methyltransferase
MTGVPPRERPGLVKAVTSVSNPVVKDVRALSQRKRRAETGLFLAEGLKLVADAVDGGWKVETLVVAAEMMRHPVAGRVAATARTHGALVLEANNAVMESVTRRENPQAVVGVFRQRLVELSALDPAAATVIVVLEGIRDPGNLGTILRTADAAGASAVVLVGETTDPFGLEAVRASMGSIFNVPVVRAGLDAFLAWREGFRGPVVGTHLSGAVDYRTVPYAEPAMLVMGTEQSGLSDRLAAACSHLVKIPMAGKADSLNLAVSTAVALYEMRRGKLRL